MNRLEIVNNISTNIERERIKLGMSQAQFAKALDMSLSTYKRIANGESSRIDVYTAYLIYKLTGRFSCELTGFNDDVINLVKRIKKLSKSQRILINSIIDTELALSAYKDESCHTEDLISVLIPTGNMTDGMILDSYNVEKLDVSNYRKAFGDALHIGIRITSNHLHPVYNKGDILLISRNPTATAIPVSLSTHRTSVHTSENCIRKTHVSSHQSTITVRPFMSTAIMLMI